MEKRKPTNKKCANTKKQGKLEREEECHLTKNPLLIDIVLDKVFEFVVSFNKFPMERQSACSELLSFRLVCQLWRNRATSVLRKISQSTRFGTCCDYYESNCKDPDKALSRFLDIMRASTLIPVNKFYFGETISVVGTGSKQLFAEFMELCGSQIAKLTFEAPSIINVSSPLENLSNFENVKLNKLKILHINSWGHERSIPKDNPKGIFFQFLQRILGAAPNLEEFDFFIFDHEYDCAQKVKGCDEVLKMLPPTVTNLRLSITCLRSSNLEILTGREKTLKKLNLSVDCFTFPKTFIHTFLAKQSATLKILRMEGQGFLRISEFPVMKELTYLYIDRVGENLFPTVFSFPKTFPKLATLVLFGMSKSNCNKLISSPEKALSVVELSMPFNFPPAPWMKNAAEFFPNVTKLHVGQHENLGPITVLRSVFRNFVNVEELHLLLSLKKNVKISIESIFSGVPDEDCRSIMASDERNLPAFSLKDFQKKPSILNLTKLKLFDLQCISDCDVSKRTFTEFSGQFVFFKIAALEEIKLVGQMKVTAECKDMLKKKLKKFYVNEF